MRPAWLLVYLGLHVGAVAAALVTVHARDVSEFEAAFANLVGERAAGLVVGTDILFLSHPGELAARGSPSGANDIPGRRGCGDLRALRAIEQTYSTRGASITLLRPFASKCFMVLHAV